MIEAVVLIFCLSLCTAAVSQNLFAARSVSKKADDSLASRELLTGMYAQFKRAEKNGVFNEPGLTAHWKARMEALYPVSSIMWKTDDKQLVFQCEGIEWTIASSADAGEIIE